MVASTRAFLRERGVEVLPRFRPAEEGEHSYLYLSHTLAVSEVLLKLELLTQQYPQIVLARLYHERWLAHYPTRVTLPDGWVDVHVAGAYRACISVEVDRATTAQRQWRRKVAALLAWEAGPYQEAFGTDLLTIAVVAVTGAARAEQIRAWTEAELTAQGKEEQADLFLFAGCAPETVSAEELYLTARFKQPFSDGAYPLIELGVGDG